MGLTLRGIVVGEVKPWKDLKQGSDMVSSTCSSNPLGTYVQDRTGCGLPGLI